MKALLAAAMFLLGAPLALVASAEAEGWAKLAPGMTPDEVLSVLGAPLVVTKANGIESWCFDRKGYALIINDTLTDWDVPPHLAKDVRKLVQIALRRESERAAAEQRRLALAANAPKSGGAASTGSP